MMLSESEERDLEDLAKIRSKLGSRWLDPPDWAELPYDFSYGFYSNKTKDIDLWILNELSRLFNRKCSNAVKK